jgi:hypothetical protein
VYTSISYFVTGKDESMAVIGRGKYNLDSPVLGYQQQKGRELHCSRLKMLIEKLLKTNQYNFKSKRCSL